VSIFYLFFIYTDLSFWIHFTAFYYFQRYNWTIYSLFWILLVRHGNGRGGVLLIFCLLVE